MTSLRPDPPPSHLYRLERGRLGDHLVPVTRPEEATHAGVVLLRRQAEDHAREVAALRAEVAHQHGRAQDLAGQLDRAGQQAVQAATAMAQRQADADRAKAAVARLAEKNGELIGEKRRLRDALTGKHPLPAVHYRVDIDRDDTARESILVVLDTFPHRDRAREALAEARRAASRYRGQLRSLRLDTTAWRAVVQRVVDG